MSSSWLLTLTLAPLGLRELVHLLSPRRPAGTSAGHYRGGLGATVGWNAIYAVLLVCAVAAILADDARHTIPGLTLLWLGALLRAFAYRALGAHYTINIYTRNDHALVTAGPYRFLRHPLHLGLNLELFGLALLAPSWATLLLATGAEALTIWRNLGEERALIAALGEPYQRYRARTFDVIDLVPRPRTSAPRA